MARVVIEDVWKRFQLRHDRADSVGNLLMRMLPGRSRPTTEEFWALKGVTVEMSDEQSLGIIGDNGSGKSTLLKILTKTMLPTRGRVKTEGRLSALIELGAGFHPDFTGRENIILNASIMGIRRREIEKKMDEIIDFAEIRPFIDTPVKYYSSGMYARLGFSVATSVEPDILIVDEVLSVGDEAFQQKCMDRIFEMKGRGISILLVSHSLDSVERLMDQVAWIHQGKLRALGPPRDTISAYRSNRISLKSANEDLTAVGSAGPILLSRCRMVGADGRDDSVLSSGLDASLTMEWINTGTKPMPSYMDVSVTRNDGLLVFEVSGLRDQQIFSIGSGDTTIVLHFQALHLVPGSYDIGVQLRDHNGAICGIWPKAASFCVRAHQQAAGVMVAPHLWMQHTP